MADLIAACWLALLMLAVALSLPWLLVLLDKGVDAMQRYGAWVRGKAHSTSSASARGAANGRHWLQSADDVRVH